MIVAFLPLPMNTKDAPKFLKQNSYIKKVSAEIGALINLALSRVANGAGDRKPKIWMRMGIPVPHPISGELYFPMNWDSPFSWG
ncbi:hypothetical protein M5689_010003 [Euphorbia peplus]|nr:hypothetical protein M5689_010003 [Euphorbia peplus]